MAATRDPGWNRDDIDFDPDGRLVIKNQALVEEIRKKMECEGGIQVAFPPAPVGPPTPPTNMCGCNWKVEGPSATQVPPELGTQPPKRDA